MIERESRKTFAAAVVCLLCGVFFFYQTHDLFAARRRAKTAALSMKSRRAPKSRALSSTEVADLTQKAGLKDVRTLDSGSGAGSVDVNFRSTAGELSRFLSLAAGSIGGCDTLTIAANDQGLLDVHISFSGRPAATPEAGASTKLAQLFALKPTIVVQKPSASVANLSKAAQSNQKSEQEAKLREDEALKARLTSSLTLSSILNNGREALAMIRTGDNSQLLRVGDSILNARIDKIDETAGTVELSYAGRINFSLTLNKGAL